MASPSNPTRKRGLWSEGELFVWLTAGALSITLLCIAVLLGVVMANGLGVLWPAPLARIVLADGEIAVGQIIREDGATDHSPERIQVKVGNRDLYGLDFRWITGDAIRSIDRPEDLAVLERREWGNFFGFLRGLPGDGEAPTWEAFQAKLAAVQRQAAALSHYREQVSARNREMLGLQDTLARLDYREAPEALRADVANQIAALEGEFEQILSAQNEAERKVRAHTVIMADAMGTEVEVILADIVRAYRPNAMNLPEKAGFYAAKLGELLFDEPRESNTEGGLFPAIFGTVMLVFFMSILSFPLGVIAGVYLRLYAKSGPLLYIVRIAVNNLAGIPSIVYGIFGLGFFVYGVGGSIDAIFYPHRLPTPTYGTGGILWASLTLGLLTVPVVIVATEEALGAIPRTMREGSYALGATRFQTLVRVLLPMAAPGIMTGFILAMARAAGEVAPLMITGVVKLAPALPLDGTFPYFHLDRKFMHLGFHIYDIGFQSPNVEAAKPMVFVTTLLLILIVMAMSSLAIYLRNKIRKSHSVTNL